MGKFKIAIRVQVLGWIAVWGSLAGASLPTSGLKIENCEIQSQKGRASQMARLQMKVANMLGVEIQALLDYHAQNLAMERRISTTPQLDEYIDKKGYNIKWRGVNTSEAQIWGYMTHYDTAIDTPWLPYRWLIMGSGFKTPREVFGYIPGERVPTVGQYLKDYRPATEYITSREEALARDEQFRRELRAVLVASVVSTAFSLPTSSSLTFGIVARIAWNAFEGNVEDYVRNLAKTTAEDWVESVLNHGLENHPQREEIVRKQIESALELVDPKEAQRIVSTIYSMHYITRDKLQSLSSAIDLAQQRGEVEDIDVASWLTSTLEAARSAQTEIEYFRDQRAILEQKCADEALNAQAIAPPSRTLRGMKNGDLAYANLVKERAECIVNQHYLLMIETKWLADLGILSQQVCERMKGAGL